MLFGKRGLSEKLGSNRYSIAKMYAWGIWRI